MKTLLACRRPLSVLPIRYRRSISRRELLKYKVALRVSPIRLIVEFIYDRDLIPTGKLKTHTPLILLEIDFDVNAIPYIIFDCSNRLIENLYMEGNIIVLRVQPAFNLHCIRAVISYQRLRHTVTGPSEPDKSLAFSGLVCSISSTLYRAPGSFNLVRFT